MPNNLEDYQKPEMYKEVSEWYWEEYDLKAWYNSAQYTIRHILRMLHLEEDPRAYNLAKNMWARGCLDEERIKDQLSKYAKSKEETSK